MEIEKTIELIRDLHPELTVSCKEGNCYKFYKLLKHLYPDAIAYYNSNHVITLIDKLFYDIDGIYNSSIENFMRLDIEPKWVQDAPNWCYELNKTEN